MKSISPSFAQAFEGILQISWKQHLWEAECKPWVTSPSVELYFPYLSSRWGWKAKGCPYREFLGFSSLKCKICFRKPAEVQHPNQFNTKWESSEPLEQNADKALDYRFATWWNGLKRGELKSTYLNPSLKFLKLKLTPYFVLRRKILRVYPLLGFATEHWNKKLTLLIGNLYDYISLLC